MTPLPIEPALPELAAVLAARSGAVLQAPPGAGKTTRVPLALLDQSWLAGSRIVMLEPRRLAARAAARRMAETLGEPVGETVGYRIRLDSKVGPKTRIEVVTEGILTRMIQDDPGLDRVGAVIFDEFHERSLNADLGLALSLEAQAGLRPDLRLLVMSATLDGGPVARLMGDVPLVTSEGRAYPVAIRWGERPTGRFEDALTALVLSALDEQPEGDVLVFLPGQGEIRRVRDRLAERRPDLVLAPLYGALSQTEQDLALLPQAGRRKVVLATAIAETSLTIEGIRVVVDGGRMRLPRFDPGSGMSRLVTLPVSKAGAEQRRGRAGRLAPGVCYRLWSEADHRALPAFTPPEMADADLAPLVLDLARWGVADPGCLAWLDPPPAAACAQARELLRRLGALDGDGRITSHGRIMAALPLHPRLAHMVVKSKAHGFGGLACDLAALLSEPDTLRDRRDADLRLRLEALHDRRHGQIREVARQLRRQCAVPSGENGSEAAGAALAFAYPDRIALCRGGDGLRYRLSNGRGAFFAEPQPLSGEPALAVADLDGDRREARILLAAPLSPAAISQYFADDMENHQRVSWDSREQVVLARRQRRLGELALEDVRWDDAPAEALVGAMVQGIREMGLACLPWTPASDGLRRRVALLRRLDGADAWPDLSDDALLVGLEIWLAPWLGGVTRRSHLERLDMAAIVQAMLSWDQKKALDAQAPTHLEVPSGSRIPIDYGAAETPILAVRLQEMFGQSDTPAIAGGRVRLTLHLLSPARRPVQVTQDLASFWNNAYRQVRSDLRGQYPRHYWPDNPLEAEPTARTKRR